MKKLPFTFSPEDFATPTSGSDTTLPSSYIIDVNDGNLQRLPHVTIEGRRKRRRTTVEEAFSNLSLQQSTAPSNHFGDQARQNHFTEPKAAPVNVVQPPFTKRVRVIGHEITPSSISKELFDDNVKLDPDNDGGAYCLRSKLSLIGNDFEMRRVSKQLEENSFLQRSEVQDEDGCFSPLIDSTTSNTPEKKVQSLQRALFAPRKTKSCDPEAKIDPVDARIEELIRHSRIRAMVKSSAEMENKMKEMQMDCTGTYDRVSGGSGLKNESIHHKPEQGAFVSSRDDFDVELSSVVQRSGKWTEISAQTEMANCQNPTGGMGKKKKIDHFEGQPERGRQSFNNSTIVNGRAWQRSKSCHSS